jgi:ATP-dependent DNA helicase RecQ
VLTIASDHDLPRGPVLLVSTDVRTRWTATVAGAMLRDQGIPAILLLALHLRP